MGLFGGESGLFGGMLNGLFGGPTSGEKQLGNYANAAYNSGEMQGFLPPELRQQFSGPLLSAWMKNLGGLQSNPGGLSPTIASAIAPWLRNESQSIATNYRGLGQNQAGAAARSNLPFSMKGALQSALDVAQERAQREARNTAMGQSEALRRQDISSVGPLLDALFQFTSTGRGQALQGFGAQAGIAQNRQAANEAFIASIIQSIASMGGGGVK